ncbi:BadF/BadG/BcrA/BcrD ATPase family protein [Salinarimonas soli]|nr:BadF/BadG/BcrA/BcrD ATPase family protein [Salinarimonas soli]
MLHLGVDGGGTGCRARLCAPDGTVLGEGRGGPANLRFGVAEALDAVAEAARHALAAAGLGEGDLARVAAGLGLAGASEPALATAAAAHPHPYGAVAIATDAGIACLGAHAGGDGGIVIVGTGTIAWAVIGGREHRIGGWGYPLSDEGSGAWIGAEALRRTLWAHDGRGPRTPLVEAVFDRFGGDPHGIVAFMTGAKPRDFGGLAPLVVDRAGAGDPLAVAIMQDAGAHVDALARRLVELGAGRIALSGGLSGPIGPFLADETRRHLVPARGDALDGAVALARSLAGPDRAAPEGR